MVLSRNGEETFNKLSPDHVRGGQSHRYTLVCGGPSHRYTLVCGGPSHRYTLVCGGPSHRYTLVCGGPSHRYTLVCGGPSHRYTLVCGGPSHRYTLVCGGPSHRYTLVCVKNSKLIGATVFELHMHGQTNKQTDPHVVPSHSSLRARVNNKPSETRRCTWVKRKIQSCFYKLKAVDTHHEIGYTEEERDVGIDVKHELCQEGSKKGMLVSMLNMSCVTRVQRKGCWYRC